MAGRKAMPQMNWFICLACGVAERDQPCQAKDAHHTSVQRTILQSTMHAGIAQLLERILAKDEATS